MEDIATLLASPAATPLCDSIAHLAPDDMQSLLPDAVSTAILQSFVAAQPFGCDHVAHYELLLRIMIPAIFAEVGTVETIAWPHSKHVVALRNARVQEPTVGPTEAQPRGLKVTLGGSTEKLLPKEASMRAMTYSVTLTTDVEHRAYELSPAPESAAVQLPVMAPDAFTRLPSVWAELRRRTVWWDPTERVPEPLEDALDRDAITYNATLIDHMRDEAKAQRLSKSGREEFLNPTMPLAMLRPSQLLIAAATDIDMAHPMIHFLFTEWAHARAAKEGVPIVVEGVEEEDKQEQEPVQPPPPLPTHVELLEEGAEDEEMPVAAEDKGPVRRMHRYRERLRGPPVTCYDLPIAALPCMLGSSFDNAMKLPPEERATAALEVPGTFICRGTLKCIRSQNVQRPNVWVMEGTHRGTVTANVRSLHPEKFRSSSTMYLYLAPSSTGASTITVDVPYLPQYLPIVTIFRFLGFETRESIEAVVFAGRDPRNTEDAEARRRFAANFSDASISATLDELYEAAGKGMKKPEDTPEKRRRQVHMQITTELLPQVGYDDSATTRLKKAVFLGLVIRDMLKVRVCVFKFVLELVLEPVFWLGLVRLGSARGPSCGQYIYCACARWPGILPGRLSMNYLERGVHSHDSRSEM